MHKHFNYNRFGFFVLVAIGAAIQAAVLEYRSDAPRIFLKNVIPLSIGILCPPVPGKVKTVIKRNTSYPIQVMRVGKTNTDHQRTMMMPLYEGEHPTAKHNNFLGMLTLIGLEDRKKGDVLVDISLTINRKGELVATAQDRKTKAAAAITIERKKNIRCGEIGLLTEVIKTLPKASEIHSPKKVKEDLKSKGHSLYRPTSMYFDDAIPSVYPENPWSEHLEELEIGGRI